MSHYSRRPQYSNVGYGPNHVQNYGRDYGRDYGQNYRRDYGQNYGTGYDPNYRNHNYQQPVTYAPRRRNSYNSYNSYPASQVVYSSDMPRYVPGGRDHYQTHHGYSRHAPNVVVASSRNLGRQATPYVTTSSSNRYRAEGHRGESIPVVAGVPYRDEWIPLSTRLRRLFGLGPRRSSTHVGKSVHIKRWGFWRHGYHTTGQYTTANYGRRGSQSTVYTL